MPLIDLPLAKLKKYRGLNPRPADMDAYWSQALKEMRAVKPDVALKPAVFQTSAADCFDLYFTGVRGARLHAKYLRPRRRAGRAPAVLHFHGYSGNAGSWSEKLKYVAQGFAVAALDCRGQGGTSEDAGGIKGNTYKGHIIRGLDDEPQNMLFRHHFLDTAQLADIVMGFPEVDARRVGTTGGSQGGGLSLACASLEPRIKRCVSLYPFLCDYRRVWEMDLAKDAYEELRTYFRLYDPRHEREQQIFTRLGYIDCQHLAPRIRADVLMGVGLMDTICPPSTQFAAYNKMRTKKHMLLYPDYTHEGIPDFTDAEYQFLMEL